MIKLHLFPVLFLPLACISNANVIGDITMVKNGVVDFNKTTTVGQVLDSWQTCMSRDWKSFKKNNGVTVVEFNCQHQAPMYMKKVKKFPILLKTTKF